MNKYILPLLLLVSFASTSLHSAIILLHGSLGANSRWYRPGGGFHDALAAEAKQYEQEITPFAWSGSISAKGIITAAHDLATKVLGIDDGKELILIGHSNGGNVISYMTTLLNAAQETAERGDTNLNELYEPFEELLQTKGFEPRNYVNSVISKKITAAYADLSAQAKKHIRRSTKPDGTHDTKPLITRIFMLGTPINTDRFYINMNVVQEVINLHSDADRIQTFVGDAKLPDEHHSVANLHVILSHDGKKYPPCHQRIHHEIVGKWLLHLPEKLAHDQMDDKAIRLLSGEVILSEEEAHYEPHQILLATASSTSE
ncbi:MAG: hypothetical protein PVJ92_01750 [Candidatus Dependentiae bacterium]|jgi:hypothetical protein